MTMIVGTVIQALIDRGALFVVNHSGGKDSQAMLIKLAQVIPAAQLHIVHAELPTADWPGIREHIEATSFGLPIDYCRAIWRDGSDKTFLGMVRDRHAKVDASVSPWPSPSQRQCTSDLKRTPIEKAIRAISARTGAKLIVSCVGLRAQESTDRANLATFKGHKGLSVAGREVYEWLPIHTMTVDRVFQTIADAGQQPHWAYAQGMSRLSCCFCIMATQADLTTAARLRPDTYAEYVRAERDTGKTMSMSRRTLPEITGVDVD